MSRVADLAFLSGNFEFLTPETEISPEFGKFSKKYGNLNKKLFFLCFFLYAPRRVHDYLTLVPRIA